MAQQETLSVAGLATEVGAGLQALPNRKTETVRALRRTFSKRIAPAAPADVVALALALLAQPGFDSRFVAYELVCHHRAALHSLGAAELAQLGRGLDSWEAVDTFACYLAGPAWRERQVPDALIHQWAHSPDRWWRRTALVCTVALNTRARGGRGDVARTLAVCALLAGDHDDMVVKALSWALRELILYDPDAVREFLMQHQGELAARVVREVRNKLTTGLKTPRVGR